MPFSNKHDQEPHTYQYLFTMAEYIHSTVYGSVVEGLTALVKASPADPVDFLGRFLIHYADHIDSLTEVCSTSCC